MSWSILLHVHNFLTAPFTDFFAQQHSCPWAVTFGTYFYDYIYIWFLALFFSWAIVYYAFKKVLQRLLRRMGLMPQRARRVTAALWSAGAGVGAGLLSASQLEASPWSTEHPRPLDTPPPPHLGMYLTVLAACQAQRLVAGCMRRGLSRHTVAELLQLLVLPAAYLSSWTELGFSITLVMSLVQVVSELARLCISLRKGPHYGTFIVFIVYCAIWVIAYFGSLPGWLVSVATTPVESQQHRTGLALLFISLAGHILITCSASPLVPAVRGCLMGTPMAEWLQAALFPGTDRAMLQIRKEAKKKRDSMEALAQARKKSLSSSPEHQPRPEVPVPKKVNNAKALMQTVRCVTLLKRKIKHMREKKAQLAESIENQE